MAMMFPKASVRVSAANILKPTNEGKLNDPCVRGCVPKIATQTPKANVIREAIISVGTIPYFANISAIKGFCSERPRYVIPT